MLQPFDMEATRDAMIVAFVATYKRLPSDAELAERMEIIKSKFLYKEQG